MANEGFAEKVFPTRTESVPQLLKPYCKGGAYGTDKSVPLSKTGFSAACKATVIYKFLRHD
jgi:hypothetical protein